MNVKPEVGSQVVHALNGVSTVIPDGDEQVPDGYVRIALSDCGGTWMVRWEYLEDLDEDPTAGFTYCMDR